VSADRDGSSSSTTRLLERELAQRSERIPGVGSIASSGGVRRQIDVRVLRDRLRATGLTVLDVSDGIELF
jgi:multidrug efflux pump subunit AcrB